MGRRRGRLGWVARMGRLVGAGLAGVGRPGKLLGGWAAALWRPNGTWQVPRSSGQWRV